MADDACGGDQSKVGEMGGICGTNGEEEKCVQGFGVETRRKETSWKINT